MIDVGKNLLRIQERIAAAAELAGANPQDITLVAVSKYVSSEAIGELFRAGQLDFGENRVQDGLAKIGELGNSQIRWHMIGRIQTNKVKYLSSFYLIQSLDRWDLAKRMSDYAVEKGIEFQCLLQVNVSGDLAKAGINLAEVDEFLAKLAGLAGIRVRGLMTITALDAQPGQTKVWFESLAGKFQELSCRELPGNVSMDWLSMGMSDDFELAIAAGANLVRVGSAIFAEEGEKTCH
jgi:pyridoxal phosphate enzyme (YggS family)